MSRRSETWSCRIDSGFIAPSAGRLLLRLADLARAHDVCWPTGLCVLGLVNQVDVRFLWRFKVLRAIRSSQCFPGFCLKAMDLDVKHLKLRIFEKHIECP